MKLYVCLCSLREFGNFAESEYIIFFQSAIDFNL